MSGSMAQIPAIQSSEATRAICASRKAIGGELDAYCSGAKWLWETVPSPNSGGTPLSDLWPFVRVGLVLLGGNGPFDSVFTPFTCRGPLSRRIETDQSLGIDRVRGVPGPQHCRAIYACDHPFVPG